MALNDSSAAPFCRTLRAARLSRARARLENLPAGGFLLLPNHLTWVDAVVLQLACPRPIRFMVFEPRSTNCAGSTRSSAPSARLPISPRHAKDGRAPGRRAHRAGEIVCIFPEGELSRSGHAAAAEARLRTHRARRRKRRSCRCGSISSGARSFRSRAGSISSNGRASFPIRSPWHSASRSPPEEADIATVRARLLELGEFCYQQRPFLRGHLGEACLRGLKKHQFDVAVIDGLDRLAAHRAARCSRRPSRSAATSARECPRAARRHRAAAGQGRAGGESRGACSRTKCR